MVAAIQIRLTVATAVAAGLLPVDPPNRQRRIGSGPQMGPLSCGDVWWTWQV